MKQYKITSENFVLPGETADPDCVMDAADLAQLKQQAGITGLLDRNSVPVTPKAWTASDNKGRIQQEQKIKPGTEAWFKLWFDRKK